MTAETMTVALVDPVGKLDQVDRALRVADDAATTIAVETPGAAASVEPAPDCVVVLDCDEVDGREQVAAALEAVDAPVVAFAIVPDASFVGDVQSMGAADVVCIPADETADELFPEVLARRLRHAAGHIDPFAPDAELLDALLESLPHDVFLKNEYGRFEEVSDRKADEYDLGRDDLIGLTDFELLPDLAQELSAEEREIMATEEPMVNKVEHYVDDGQDRWVSTTKAPRYDGDGEVVGVIGSVRDVTRQKRREEMMNALHVASRRLLAAETRREIAAVTVDVAEDVPDLPSVEVALEEDGSLVPAAVGGDADESPFRRHEALFRECYATGAATAIGPDGDSGRLDELSAPDPRALAIPLGEHGVLGFASTTGVFDEFGVDLAEVLAANVAAVLDQVAREEELARQNERLEEFAGIVSHDLRNPLSVARGYLDELEEDGEIVDEIEWALDRIDRLTDELLTLARSGDVVGDTSTESLEALAFEAWQAVETDTAILTVEGELGELEADRERLLELFENLFRNAVEHAHHPDDPVRVTVGTLEADDREAGFYVADDGPGLPDDERTEAFEQGYTTAEEGTGLGLHIVETIAEAHGWTVRATDARDGSEGTDGSRSSGDERSESEARQTQSGRGARFEFLTAT